MITCNIADGTKLNACEKKHIDSGYICTRMKFHSGPHHAHTAEDCLVIWGEITIADDILEAAKPKISNHGGPAFPFMVPHQFQHIHSGMTLRQWYIGQILSGMDIQAKIESYGYDRIKFLIENIFDFANELIDFDGTYGKEKKQNG